MFDALTDKLQGVFSGLRGRGKLTESDIDQAMRAIRLSLLEADVSLPVVKQLTTAIAERAKGGIAVAIRSDLGIPVKLVGSGERLEDLQPFDARAFARAIFSPEG